MNEYLMLLLAMMIGLALCALVIVPLMLPKREPVRLKHWQKLLCVMRQWLIPLSWYVRTDRLALANAPETGVHIGGRVTRKTDAAISTRYLLGKVGTDALHIAVAGAADTPWGVICDEAGAAEDLVNVQALACADTTVKVITDGSATIAAGDVLVPAAGGKVKKIAAGAGNYYVVGIALEAPTTADGEQLEMIPIGAWKTQ